MTAADLLDRMELFDAELETGSAEKDETRALLALNVAMDYFESVAATFPKIFQSHSTISTTASTETTTFPSGLLRLDDLWFIDATTLRPSYQLRNLQDTGSHVASLPWPLTIALAPGSPGQPRAYYASQSRIYWAPLPDAAHTIRYYGLIAATDFATRATTFAYPDDVSLPMASFATKVLRIGRDDPIQELESQANDFFVPVLRRHQRLIRTRPSSRYYGEVHTV